MAGLYAIVGAGHAGTAAAAAMRAAGFEGRILLIGDDPHLPYERPPLSKAALKEGAEGAAAIYPADFYESRRVELKLGAAVAGLDAQARRLTLGNGESIDFDKLLIATGAQARRYPLLDALGDKVHVVRTLDDAVRLRPAMQPGRRLLVVGGGVIGLEVAATASAMGLAVTVLERAPRLLARGTPEPLAQMLLAAHDRARVQVHTSVELVSAGVQGDALFVEAADGRRFAGDLIVYGIGVTLNDGLARQAGLEMDDGIIVDAACRTSLPHIYAAGDVARRHDWTSGAMVRQENWASALHQGALAGRAMAGVEAGPDEEIPWFWTDQYGVNYQVAGAVQADRWVRRDGQGRSLLFGLTGGVLTGAIGVDAGADMRMARKLIGQGVRPDAAALADPAISLRQIVAMSKAA